MASLMKQTLDVFGRRLFANYRMVLYRSSLKNYGKLGSCDTIRHQRFSSVSDEHPISRYPIPEQHDLPQDIQDRISEMAEKSGFVPNVFKVLAHRPAEFSAFFAYYDALMAKETGSLTKADKEMIVVATSSNNNCLYCVISHSALFRIYSKNQTLADQVAVNWECAELDPRQRAILEFAMTVCKSETVTEDHFEKLEKHGLDREDAWDIGAIAALFALSNRMAHLTDMRPNKEFYLMGRVPMAKKK